MTLATWPAGYRAAALRDRFVGVAVLHYQPSPAQPQLDGTDANIGTLQLVKL